MTTPVHRFRMAVVRHLGKPLTPEVAAAVEVEAFAPCYLEEQTHSAGRMTVSIAQRQEYLDFVNGAFSTRHLMDRVRLLAVLRDGEIAAVVMYSRLSPRSCEMTIATDGARDWATRATLRWIFGLAFEQMNLARVTVVVHSRNMASLSLCDRLGYVMEGVVREAFEDGGDGVVMGMLRRECRWIGGAR